MVRFSLAGTTLALAASVLGSPAPITPDPNGAAHVGNGKGEQFITGACLSTADCGQTAVPACCAFIAGSAATGICSGVAVANTNGKSGCGFGDPPGTGSAAAPAASEAAAAAPPAAPAAPAADAGSAVCTVDSSLAGSQNVGTGAGAQFITGQCLSKADCASACCVAQASGPALCKAVLVTQEAGKSCDFSCGASGSAAPAASAAPATAQADAAPAAPAADASSASCAVNSALAGSQNVGTGAAAQFITGQCFSKADCASGCCVAQADGTAQCKAVLVTQEAGKSCDFSCTPGSAPAAPAAAAAATPSTLVVSPATAGSGSCSVNQDLAGNQNVGKGTASQFITGQCFSDGDCASGCCVAQASGTALCKAKLVTQQAGQSCGFTCAA